MADFYLFTPVRTKPDTTGRSGPPHGLRVLVPLVGLALTGCAWPLAGDASKPELNSNAWVEKKYETAKGLLEGGHYGLALENFRDVLRHDSYSVKALNGLAAAYDKLGRHDLAQRYYKKALVVEPTSFQTLNNIGYSYMLAGKYKEAREFLGKAAEIDGANATVVANLKELVAKEVASVEGKGKAAASGAGGAQEAEPSAEAGNERRMWVERSTTGVQVLITKPDSALVEWADAQGIEPRWVHLDREDGGEHAGRIAVLTERFPTGPNQNAEKEPILTAASSQGSGPDAGPAVAAVTSPAVAGPEALPVPAPNGGVGASPATANAMTAPAPSNDAPSAVGSSGPASASGDSDVADIDMKNAAEAPRSPAAPPAVAETPPGPAETPAEATQNSASTSDAMTAQSGVRAPEAPAATPTAPVEKSPVVTDRGDGAPVNLTPTAPADTSDGGTPVQSAGVFSATDAREPKGDAPTNWIETPWRDPAAPGATESATVVPGGEAPDSVPQASTRPMPPTGAAPQDSMAAAKAGSTAAPPAPDAAKQAKGSDQLAVLPPAQPDVAGYGPRQDAALPRILEISNGAGRLAMAARMEEHLKSLNIPRVKLTNAMSFTNKKSVLYFKPGYEAAAMRLSLELPLRPELRRHPALASDLRLVLGGDMLDFDRQLIARKLVADSTR